MPRGGKFVGTRLGGWTITTPGSVAFMILSGS
jgi:hypothetical protein